MPRDLCRAVLPAGAFSAVACRRRLRDRTEAGVWPSLHEILLAEPRRADLLDMNDAAVDGSHVRPLKGGSHRTFTSRPRLSGQHDVTQLMPLLDAIPRSRGLVGGPRHRPRRLLADRGYDYDKHRPRIRHWQDQAGRRAILRTAPPVQAPGDPNLILK
jgi:hypothetical protein